MHKCVLMIAAFFVGACSPQSAVTQVPVPDRTEESQQAMRSMEEGNYAEAYCAWRSLADDGDAEAQYSLGWLYHNGYGLRVNDLEAQRWWQMAANQNHSEAHFALGNLFRLGGNNVSVDTSKGMLHLAAAAVLGEDDARLLLKIMLSKGGSAVEATLPELIKEQPGALGSSLTVSANSAALRAGTGAKSATTAELAQGTVLVELGRRGNWAEVGVVATGQRGWVKVEEVTPRQP